MSDIGERFFLPKLLRHLARVAPGVSVATVSQSLPELAAGLAGGDVDLVARFLPSLGKQVHEQRLFRERFIYVSAPDTPAVRGVLLNELLRTLPHSLPVRPGRRMPRLLNGC